MVVAPMSAVWIREQAIDFTSNAMQVEETKVMIKIYGQDDSTLKLFAKPFKQYVWACIGGAIGLGTVATWAFNAWSMALNRQTKSNNVNQLGKLPNALWFTIGAIVNQGEINYDVFFVVCCLISCLPHKYPTIAVPGLGNLTLKCIYFAGSVYIPNHHSGRVFMSAWWLYCIILGAVYTGNLIAFLSVIKIKYPYNTLDEMVEQNEYTFGTLGGTYQELSLKVNVILCKNNQQLWQCLKKRAGTFTIKVKDCGA